MLEYFEELCGCEISDDPQTVSFTYTVQSPQSSGGEKKLEPYKTVHTEFLIWSDQSLIANVAGVLGLTIGFSFIGTIEWFTGKLIKTWQGTSSLNLMKKLHLVNLCFFKYLYLYMSGKIQPVIYAEWGPTKY